MFFGGGVFDGVREGGGVFWRAREGRGRGGCFCGVREVFLWYAWGREGGVFLWCEGGLLLWCEGRNGKQRVRIDET